MSHLFRFAPQIQFSPNPENPSEQRAGIAYGPETLVNFGHNIQIEVSTATAYALGQNSPRKRITVWGHFDTGASRTSIDHNLATHLGLISHGQSTGFTASGPSATPNYTVDVSFLNTGLKSIANLEAGSCNLPFDLDGDLSDPKNSGLLIGRDIMSLWNIVWHGPTSTVFISD